MSSLDRPMSGEMLVFDLDRERAVAEDAELLSRNGRNARTLTKEGGLRVTVVTVAGGGLISEHQADGPITVQVLSGSILFRAVGREHELQPGSLLTLAEGVPHSVTSAEGGSFLLTVCRPGTVG